MFFENNRTVSSLLFEHPIVDNWFPVKYSFNYLNGCPYDCLYCPVNWREKKIIVKKQNAYTCLKQEVNKIKTPTLIGIGGGYNETFLTLPPTEKQHPHPQGIQSDWEKLISWQDKLLKDSFSFLEKTPHRLLFLTQTEGFEKYIPRFERYKIKPIVIVTINAVDLKTSKRFSHDIPSFEKKIKLIQKLVYHQFPVGVLLSPIIPMVNDQVIFFETIIPLLKANKVSFVLHDFISLAGLKHLKNSHFFTEEEEKEIQPYLEETPKRTAEGTTKETIEEKQQQNLSLWNSYKSKTESKLIHVLKNNYIRPRIDIALLKDYLLEKELVSVIFGQLYYYFYYRGEQRLSYLYTADYIGKMNNNFFLEKCRKNQLADLRGIGYFLQSKIQEMVFKKDYSYYYDTIEEFYSPSNSDNK